MDQRNYNINLQLISWVFYPATINATCILTWVSKSISVLIKMSSIECWGEVDTCRSLINTIGSALSVSADVEQTLLSIANFILYIKILLNRVIDSHYSFTHWVKSVDFSWWWLLITSTATIWELNIYDDLHWTFLDYIHQSTEEIPLMIDVNEHRCDEKFLHIWIRWSHLHP